EIEQRLGVFWADWFCWTEAAPVASFQTRAVRKRLCASVTVDCNKLIELSVCNFDRRHHFGVQLDRLRLHDCQYDVLDADKKFRERVARARGIKQELLVNDVLVAVRVQREDAHAGTELKISHMDRVADANDEVGGTKGAGDGWKDDALLEVELGLGGIEK